MDIHSLTPLLPTLLPLLGGVILDSLLGDPYRLPHPIRLFGWLIHQGERHFNRDKRRKIKGALLSLSLILSAGALFYGLDLLFSGCLWGQLLFRTLFFYYGISSRCLIEEVRKVEKKLQNEDISQARTQLSQIVGRDTAHLDAGDIRRAALETLSENLSDGVIAPILFYLVAGIPGMMAYKMINTLDSMIGYKNERFGDFGYFAAKTDDLANYIPARVTALLMLLSSAKIARLPFVVRYGKCHSSPNSGYPEAALAAILSCRFGGANYYGGIIVEKPWIGNDPRPLTHRDLVRGCWVNIRSLLLLCLIILLFSILFLS